MKLSDFSLTLAVVFNKLFFWSKQLKKISNYFIGITLAACVSVSVLAEDYKIGVVNPLQLLKKSPQAAEMAVQLQKEFTREDTELIAAQRKLKELEDRLVKDTAIMSESEKQKLEHNIINQRRDVKRSVDELREDVAYRKNEELSKIQKEIIAAIQVVAKANNYDIIFGEGVLFADLKIDITEQVIDYLKDNDNAVAEQ